MDKRTRNPISDKYKIHHEQDCECVRCIDIEIDQFNPRRVLRKRPPKLPSRSLLRSPRPIITDKQKEKNELLINTICNNITVKLEQELNQELDQLPTRKSYKDLEE